MYNLKNADRIVFDCLNNELEYQKYTIRLIASENYVSNAVIEACSSVVMNKYCEGYPGARYYQGQKFADEIEHIAIERAKSLFGAEHVNVQPYSGSPANLAVYGALINPGDKILSMDLTAGGHLTHGAKVSITGKLYEAHHYSTDLETGRIDYNEVQRIAQKERPKIVIAGHSAYPRQIDFKKFRSICDEVGAILFVDMSHIAGLVAGGAHPSPIPYADVVTTTTHKTLRGPRGAMILCKSAYAKQIDKAVFPGLQGGPHMNTIAGIAVALGEASTNQFKAYAAQVITNAKQLAENLMSEGITLISAGTDNHIVLADVTSIGTSGKPAALSLENAGIIANKNAIPRDTRRPVDPSGIRLGTAAVTSRGMGGSEMALIGRWIVECLKNVGDKNKEAKILSEVVELCKTKSLQPSN